MISGCRALVVRAADSPALAADDWRSGRDGEVVDDGTFSTWNTAVVVDCIASTSRVYLWSRAFGCNGFLGNGYAGVTTIVCTGLQQQPAQMFLTWRAMYAYDASDDNPCLFFSLPLDVVVLGAAICIRNCCISQMNTKPTKSCARECATSNLSSSGSQGRLSSSVQV